MKIVLQKIGLIANANIPENAAYLQKLIKYLKDKKKEVLLDKGGSGKLLPKEKAWGIEKVVAEAD